MSFFLPSRLIDLEYLISEPDDEYEKIAKPFSKEIDLAFFVVNFGYSKQDYEALTPKEKTFIYKAWENKLVSDTSHLYNAMFTASYNVQRTKNKKALKLWKKPQVNKGNMEVISENMSVVKQVEKNEGRDWVKRIYDFNGIQSIKEEGE